MKLSWPLVTPSNQSMTQQHWLVGITLCLIRMFLMERFQGQVAKDYIRNRLLQKWSISPVRLLRSWVFVCVCGWGGFKLQKRNSQALMSSSTSPSCPLSHQGTIPKTAPETELTSLMHNRLCCRQWLTEIVQFIAGRDWHNKQRKHQTWLLLIWCQTSKLSEWASCVSISVLISH